MPRFHLHIIIFLLLLAITASAEETVVVGNVVDAVTGAPLENVNIHYKGTTIGTTTNQEGVFLLRTDNTAKATLEVSAVGYRKQKFKIEPGQQAGIQVELEQQTTALADVFILPGENPALDIMRRVREQRAANDLTTNDSLSFRLQSEQQLCLSQLPARMLQRLMADSLTMTYYKGDDTIHVLPVYEAKRQYRLHGNTISLTAPPVTHTAGGSEEDYALLLSGIDERPLNFYRQSVSVMSKDFISPLSSNGNSYYNFYLIDSLDAPKRYILHFVPKNLYSYCLKGSMEIDSATCALRHISASVPRQAAVNYLTVFAVEQTYDDSRCLNHEDLTAMFEVTLKSDTTHRFPSVLLTRQSAISSQQSAISNQPHLADKADSVASPLSEASSLQHSNIPSLSKASDKIDKLSDTFIFRVARMLAHIINTGNIPTGTMIDIGNAVEMLGGSPYEGFHIGLPFTTNERLCKYVEVSAYLAYGFGDHAYKGKGQVRAKLPTERRHLIGAYYWDHYAQTDLSEMYFRLRENDIFYADQDFAHMVFGGIRRKSDYILPATRRRELRIWTENEWTDNIETQFSFGMGRMGYGDIMEIVNNQKSVEQTNIGQASQTHTRISVYDAIPSYRFKTLRAEIRVGFHERKVDLFMRRVHVRNNYPVVRLMLEGGAYRTDLMERDRLYGRITAMVQHSVPLGICGQLDYSAMAGIVIGKVPYPLLEHFTGNQSYTYDPYRFTLISQSEYAADRFLMAHIHWNMQGLLFNLIPYVQRLRLRELVELKLAWGTLNYDHASVVPLPATLKPLNIPYVEAGIGIGNILRVADIYAVFRLTNNKPSAVSSQQSATGTSTQPTPFWGIRARFSLGL